MKIKLALLGAILALGLSACATPYAPAGITGGYSENRIDDTTYAVTFAGNGYTTAETVQTFWLYRCAELTLEKGYDGFEIKSDVRFISNIRPATDSDGAVLILAHGGGGGGGGGGHGGGGHGGGSHSGSTYIYTPVYIENMDKPVLSARIRFLKGPIAVNPPKVFDAGALKATLTPLVKQMACGKNVCVHPHTYLQAPAAPQTAT